jgi:hypothetical protein
MFNFILKIIAYLAGLFGIITVDQPHFKLIKEYPNFEIRRYPLILTAQTNFTEDKKTYMVLANYIGLLGEPQNSEKREIDMMAPVLANSTIMAFILPK